MFLAIHTGKVSLPRFDLCNRYIYIPLIVHIILIHLAISSIISKFSITHFSDRDQQLHLHGG